MVRLEQHHYALVHQVAYGPVAQQMHRLGAERRLFVAVCQIAYRVSMILASVSISGGNLLGGVGRALAHADLCDGRRAR